MSPPSLSLLAYQTRLPLAACYWWHGINKQKKNAFETVATLQTVPTNP